MLFINYSRCTTCIKAKKWLDSHHLDYQNRAIVEETPTVEELKKWIDQSQLPIKKFFNTSGKKYKELQLKDKLKEMTDEEKINLLASDGMLIKRPLLITEDKVLVGFKEEEWKQIL